MCGAALAAALSIAGAGTAFAQETEAEMRSFTAEEIEAIAIPATSFDYEKANAADFDKYYYFHREDTSFDQAFADITECDDLSSGLASYKGEMENTFYNQQMYGALSPFAVMLSDAIHGSAARREMRRVNMRNCMGYKGYQRYGIEKDLWKEFNFEEGGGREDEDVRNAALLAQARVASGPTPTTEVLVR